MRTKPSDTQSNNFQLLKPALLGEWIVRRPGIWQMLFLSDTELGSLASERGVMSLSLGDHVKRLWQLGLLRADLVESPEQLEVTGLVFLEQNADGTYYYADEREPDKHTNGFGSAIAKLSPYPKEVKLQFHPFRYYVLYQIDRVIRLHVHPMQVFIAAERYSEVVDGQLQEFQQWSSGEDFYNAVKRWNNITSFAVACEPYMYERIFGTYRRWLYSEDEHRRLVREYWDELKISVQAIVLEKIEEARDDLCTNAEILDPNKDIHTIIRMTEGDVRLKNIKGHLGGAIYLLSMAEMLRRVAEDAFSIELKEEDELGFGMTSVGIKGKLYGANRILDHNRNVRNEFLREFGLDYGVRVRWYVEGLTEFYAIDAILGNYSAVDIQNLRGNVVAKIGKGVAFRDNLRSDIRSSVFSFVSVDGDRGDYLRAVRKAAEDDEICGTFFISTPDFEFENFTVDELTEILWEVAVENGAKQEEKVALYAALVSTTTGDELFKAAQHAIPVLQQFGKGKEWGGKLMVFAWNNPKMINSDNGVTRTRPIVDAINFAIRAARSDYHISRADYKVDPKSGRSVLRNS